MSDQLNINLKLYRERLQDKYSKIGDSSSKKSDFQLNSSRKSITKNAPTLDIISNRLKDYSNHQSSNKRIYQSPSNQIPNSPVRLNGMQQKLNKIYFRIKSITTSPQVVMNNFSHPLGSPKTEVTQFQGFRQSPRAITERSEPTLLKRYNSNGDITSQIPFHDLVNMRNKLENCDINAAHITPTYLSEIVKLAHVLNNQLTKK